MVSRGRAYSWLLLLSCAVAPAWARDASPPVQTQALELSDLGAPAFTNFSSRDGLPYAVVVDVRTDRDGFVWAASPVGLSRYDGRRWVASDDPAMAHAVTSLWVDWQGTLWAGFRNDGLAHYDGTRWHVENTSTGLHSQQIRRFAETTDADGARTLWVTTWDKGLMVRRNGRWQADPDNATLPRGAVLAMAQTQHLGGHRRQWAGTGTDGLWYRDEGIPGWRRWPLDGVDSAQIEYLFASERNGHESLWISVFGVGLLRLSDAGERRWTRDTGELPSNELYDIAATGLPGGDHAIWVSSRSGLIRVHDGGTHDGSVQVFDRGHGLPSDVIRGINAWRSPGGDDVLWLATEGGISRTIPGADAWSTASLMGARSIGVSGVLVEPDGSGDERLWVASSGEGLGLYAHGRWRHYTAANGFLPGPSAGMVVATTAVDGTRTHWIGAGRGELLRVHLRDGGDPVFEQIQTPWPKVTGEAVRDVLARTIDGRAELWVGTRQSGIWRWRDGQWAPFRPAAVDGQWSIVTLLEQRDGNGRPWLWASTNQGLARFDGQDWKMFGHDAGLPDESLVGMRLFVDADADAGSHPVLWIGSTSAGIVRVDVSDPRHPRVLPATLPPQPDATAYGALQDSTGRIYICTNNGVQQLTPDAVTGYRSRVFTRRDGMVHDECNTNAQFIDAHDRFWTGTLGGLAVYDPRREIPDTQPKPLRLTGMHVDPVTRAVEVEFALLSWHREAESRFRTQLIGIEDAPGEWSGRASRSFDALPPGDYRLRVEARDHAGNASIPIEVPISVAAQWWQRPWIYAVGVLALVLLGYAGAQWRTRALKAQRHALEQRVAARTAELDEANARLVDLSYRDALTGLANRRRLLDQLGQLSGDPTTTTCCALILIDVDHFKDYNDRHGHLAGDEALRQVAGTLLDFAPDDALVARYGGEEFACLLPGTDAVQATAIAELLRSAVQACAIPVAGEEHAGGVTISAGVADSVLADADDIDHLLRDADTALYQAKRDGRNRVSVALP
jgi:diguanylate cyclase (GGDEF)-like protein